MSDSRPAGWAGRVDPGNDLRWHQVVLPWRAGEQLGVVLLGLASDEGVRRNQGRVGAALGPTALRGAMSNLPTVNGVPLYDGGDVPCADGDLEGAQQTFATTSAELLRAENLVIGLGGGHEIAWPGIDALLRSGCVATGARLGILNLDAHFDLRQADAPNSGTSFRQALEAGRTRGLHVEYRVLGVSESSNTAGLFAAAEEFGVNWRTDEELGILHLGRRLEELAAWFAELDALYLTVCLDVLPAHTAPGVSAPAARGVSLDVIEALVACAAASGKLRAADVAELCPPFDIDGRTARMAARLIWRIVRDRAR